MDRIEENKKALKNLRDNGDDHELEREVEHWIYFSSEENIDEFIKEVQNKGYKFIKKDMVEGEFEVLISRVDNIILENVNEYVLELEDISKKHGGEYDGWGCYVKQRYQYENYYIRGR